MIVFCLHRVVPEKSEGLWPYQIRSTVLTINQLDHLLGEIKHRYEIIKASEVLEALRERPQGAAVLTFDDGYRDNLVHAAPLLKDHGLSAVLFSATGLLDSTIPFLAVDAWYWLFLHTAVRRTNIECCGQKQRFDLDDENSRKEIVLGRMKGAFLRLSMPERLQVLNQLAVRLRLSKGFEQLRELYLTDKDLLSLYQDFGWRVAPHGHTHELLDRLSTAQVSKEIKTSVDYLKGHPGYTPLFAYPDGRYSCNAGFVLSNLGIRYAFGLAKDNSRTSVTPADPDLFLPREILKKDCCKTSP